MESLLHNEVGFFSERLLAVLNIKS